MERLNNRKKQLSTLTLYIGMVVIFVLFAVICSLSGKNFLTINNIFNIITQASIISIIAIGTAVVIVTGGIDLSVGSVVGLVGIMGALMIKAEISISIVILACVLVGALIGLINGMLISLGKVPSFIVTLGMMQVIRGVAQAINSGQPVSGLPKGINVLMTYRVFGEIPIAIFYVIGFYLIIIFVMSYTKFGRQVYAIGGNRIAARLSGIKVNKVEIGVYVVGGIFAAIGGVLLLARLNYADPQGGSGYEMNAIAAAVIGGISMSGGKGRVGNALVGAIILSILTCGLQILNINIYFQQIISGLVIVAAVFVDKQKERKSE